METPFSMTQEKQSVNRKTKESALSIGIDEIAHLIFQGIPTSVLILPDSKFPDTINAYGKTTVLLHVWRLKTYVIIINLLLCTFVIVRERY